MVMMIMIFINYTTGANGDPPMVAIQTKMAKFALLPTRCNTKRMPEPLKEQVQKIYDPKKKLKPMTRATRFAGKFLYILLCMCLCMCMCMCMPLYMCMCMTLYMCMCMLVCLLICLQGCLFVFFLSRQQANK